MIRAIKAVSVQRGRDPRDFTLVAFGGSGPIHAACAGARARHPARARAAATGRLLGGRPAPGAARVPREEDVPAPAARPLARRSCEPRSPASRRRRAPASGRTRWALAHGAFEFERFVEMRYVGQGFELPVPLPALGRRGRVLDGLAAPSTPSTNAPTGTGRGTRPRSSTCGSCCARPIRRRSRRRLPWRPLIRGDRVARCPLRGAVRDARDAGAPSGRRRPASPRPGPFVVEDYDATTVVPPDFTLRRDAADNLLIEAGA